MTDQSGRRTDRAIVFDMDGILIDSEPLWRRAEIECFGLVGLSLTEEDCCRTTGLRIDEVADYWFERMPWQGASTEEVSTNIIERMVELIRCEGEPMPSALAALDAADSLDLRIALASSSPLRLIDTVLERFDWTNRFEAVRSAEHEARGKPDPDVYLSAAREIALPPARCIAVEDSGAGVASALAAGMRCVAVPAPENKDRDQILRATWRIESLRALPALLRDMDWDVPA